MTPISLSPFANHLWQSTVFACVAAILTLALRKNRAQIRYMVWQAASIKFLIPWALLVSVGSRIDLADGRSRSSTGGTGDPADRAAVCAIAGACLRSALHGRDAADRAGAAVGGLACRLRVLAFALVDTLAADADGAPYRVAFAGRRSNPGDVFSHEPGTGFVRCFPPGSVAS